MQQQKFPTKMPSPLFVFVIQEDGNRSSNTIQARTYDTVPACAESVTSVADTTEIQQREELRANVTALKSISAVSKTEVADFIADRSNVTTKKYQAIFMRVINDHRTSEPELESAIDLIGLLPQITKTGVVSKAATDFASSDDGEVCLQEHFKISNAEGYPTMLPRPKSAGAAGAVPASKMQVKKSRITSDGRATARLIAKKKIGEDFAAEARKFIPCQKSVEAGRKELRADATICKLTTSIILSETIVTQSENVEIMLDQVHDERVRCKEADTQTKQVDDTPNVDEADEITKPENGRCKARSHFTISEAELHAETEVYSAWIRVHTADSCYRSVVYFTYITSDGTDGNVTVTLFRWQGQS